MGWHQPTSSGVVTSPFGPRKPVKTSQGISTSNHQGADYRAATGANIFAVGDGVVTFTGSHKLRGSYIIVQHGDGTSTLYQHLSRIGVKRGARVKGGTVLGKAGATGNVSGAHLHLEAYNTKSGTRTDPVAYLAARLAAQNGEPAPTPQPAPAKPSTGRLGGRTLRLGDHGDDVRELQAILNAWYPAKRNRAPLTEDGVFGPRTDERVRYLQHRAGLVADGIAGPKTFKALGIK